MASKNNWDADGMKGTLISDMEKEVKDGVSQVAAERTQQKPATNPDDLVEPTKGVQTYLTVTRYRQLSDIKLKRGKGATIGSLAAEAICDWLDCQQAAANGGK